LIPWNPVPGLPYERPSEARILAFQNLVRKPDLPVYIRTPRGDDAAAACGQLAARTREAPAGFVDLKVTGCVS
jgi:23S rRNA (adenine2503-C2)-methyltransferase